MNRARNRLAVLLALSLAAGCQSSDQADQSGPSTTQDPTPAEVPQTTRPGETTATAVIADLRAHGFQVTGVKEGEASLSGAKDNLDARIDGVEAGILVFAMVEDAHGWADLSDQLGGIAVVGDTWAISLDSDADRAKSRVLAGRIAQAIGGTVR